jgi:hypothetical protein
MREIGGMGVMVRKSERVSMSTFRRNWSLRGVTKTATRAWKGIGVDRSVEEIQKIRIMKIWLKPEHLPKI